MQAGTCVNGRYRLARSLGRGGVAEVWLAHDQRLGDREVAFKVMFPHLATDPTLVQRFRDEAKRAASLKDLHIVPIYDVGHDTQTGLPFIVMEFLDGGTLREWIARRPTVPEVMARFAEIARGVRAIHAQGYIHRDLKPTNILLSESGHAKIGDFGIARHVREAGATQHGMFWGTIEYAAPEQIRGLAATPAGDIYSLGVLLWEMLAGRRPFVGDDALVQQAHLVTPAPDVRAANPSVPPEVAALVAKMLVKDPAQRHPRDGAGLVAALATLGGQPTRLHAAAPAPAAPTRAWAAWPPNGSRPAADVPTRVVQALAATGRANATQARQEWQTFAVWLARQTRQGTQALRALPGTLARGGAAGQREVAALRRLLEQTVVGIVEGIAAGLVGGAVGGAVGSVVGWAIYALARGAIPRWIASFLATETMEQVTALQRVIGLEIARWAIGGALLGAMVGFVVGAVAGGALALGTAQRRSLLRRFWSASWRSVGWALRGAWLGLGYRTVALALGAGARVFFGAELSSRAFRAGDRLGTDLLAYAAVGAIGWALVRGIEAALGQPTRPLRGSLLGNTVLSALEGALCLAVGALALNALLQTSALDLAQTVDFVLVEGRALLARLGSARDQLLVGLVVGALAGLRSRPRPAPVVKS